MRTTEIIYAHGHKNVQSAHKTTFEITKETSLTKRGDCVVAVGATKGAADLNSRLKKAAKKKNAKITIKIEAGRVKESVRARGSPQLSFTHPTDLVVRKSGYVCGRTLAVRADKAASDLSRKLVEKMRDPLQEIKITLTVEDY
ncbi:DUF371 domain-containing protein [Candidatus Bathyarchaeota archaeon]|nr:DUF371 domain-containing protein [Candidatus Bathyarchaeota archaeon]